MNLPTVVTGAFLAGLMPGIIAPLAWPLVVMAVEGSFPDWSVYPSAAVVISLFAIFFGLMGSVFVGSPILVVLSRFNLNLPWLAAVFGVFVSLSAFAVIELPNGDWPISESWPLAVFFAINGAVCGYVASSYMHSNKSGLRTR